MLYVGQAGSGRHQETKPMHNNMFEDDTSPDEVPYHAKMKFQEKLRHLTVQGLGEVA